MEYSSTMNYEGKLVSNLKFFEPLSIDVQMEYEIDDNLFPGLDNPEQNPPTLIYDLTQEDDEEETTSSDDDIISLIDSMNADYCPDTSLDNVDNIIQFLMEEKQTQTTPDKSTGTQHTDKSRNTRTRKRVHHVQTETVPSHSMSDENTYPDHTNSFLNTSRLQPETSMGYTVLTDSTNTLFNHTSSHTKSSASHPVDLHNLALHNSMLQQHKGLTNSTQCSNLLPLHMSTQSVLPLDLYKLTQVSCSVDRRKVNSSNRYHPWRNNTILPIRGY